MKLPLSIYGRRQMSLFTGTFILLFIISLIFKHFIVSIVSLMLALFVLYFFRDPARRITASARDILAPADGRIVGIEKVFDKTYINAEAVKVSIFLSIFDVHLNRMPCAGVIEYISYKKGKFYNAARSKASESNERTIIGILDKDYNVKLIVKQIAGVIARRIICELREGQEVLAGQKFGMIMFGSRTEVYVPVGHFELKVKVGQHVKAGKTVVGALK